MISINICIRGVQSSHQYLLALPCRQNKAQTPCLSVPDGLRELSHGPLMWVVDNQSFVDGFNYFLVLIGFKCIYFGKVVNVKFCI